MDDEWSNASGPPPQMQSSTFRHDVVSTEKEQQQAKDASTTRDKREKGKRVLSSFRFEEARRTDFLLTVALDDVHGCVEVVFRERCVKMAVPRSRKSFENRFGGKFEMAPAAPTLLRI